MPYRKTIATLGAIAASGVLAAPALAVPEGIVKHTTPVVDSTERSFGGGESDGGGSASPQLEAIAQCESGGDPTAVGGGGQFRGKYQFMQSTWDSVAPEGYAGVDPASAPESVQDQAAANLLAQSGTSPWPVCGS